MGVRSLRSLCVCAHVRGGAGHRCSVTMPAKRSRRKSLCLRRPSGFNLLFEGCGSRTARNYEAARRTLLEAARLEPHNYVTWALIGDLRHAARRLPGGSAELSTCLRPRLPGSQPVVQGGARRDC